MRYQAIIFDLNGVIVNDEPLHLKASVLACAEVGISVPPDFWLANKGRKAEDTLTQVVRLFSTGAQDIPKLLESKINHYFALANEKLELVDRVVEVIQLLRSQNYRLGLATSNYKKVQGFVFQKFALDQYFDMIVTADDIKNAKPDPEIYLAIAAKMQVQPAQCLVMEDSINGIVAAKAAGCQVLAIATTFTVEALKKTEADYIYDDFAKALESKNDWLN